MSFVLRSTARCEVEVTARYPRLHADHLEVLEGPSRPSADFFHTPQDLHRRLAQRLGQYGDLRLQLLLPAGLAAFPEVGLPPRYVGPYRMVWRGQ